MTTFGAVNNATELRGSVWMGQGDIFTSGTKTTAGNDPSVRVVRLDATAEEASFTLALPDDWEPTGTNKLTTHWALNTSESNGDTLDLSVVYITVKLTEDLNKAPTTLTQQDTVTTAEGLTANDLYSFDHTFDNENATNPLEAGILLLSWEINLTNILEVGAMRLVGFNFTYDRTN